jgi:hypothetical protein
MEHLVILGKDEEEEEVHHNALHSKDSGMEEEDSEVFHRESDVHSLGDTYN